MARFDEIFLKYHHCLFCYAKKFVESEEDALNIVQDVFMTVYEREIFCKKEDYVIPYLYNAVRHHCLNFIKHRKVVRKYENKVSTELKMMEIEFYSSGEKSLIERENYQTLFDAINSLSNVNKEIIVLSRFERLKNREISEKLQIPIRTVETRLFRALAQLKEILTQNNFFVFLVFNNIKVL